MSFQAYFPIWNKLQRGVITIADREKLEKLSEG